MRITVHNSFAPSLGVLRMISAFWASLVPYVRLALLLPRVHRLLAVVLALGVLLGTALPLAITIAIGQLAASVPEAIAGGSGSEAARTSIAWLLTVGGLTVAMHATFRTRGAVAYSLGLRVNLHLGQRVMRALNRPFGIAHLEDSQTQDLLHRTQALSGLERFSPGVALGALAFMAGNWLLSISYTVVLASFDVRLALGLFLIVLIASHVQRREFLRVTEVLTGQADVARRGDYWRDLALRPETAKDVRIWGLSTGLSGRFAREWLRVMELVWEERARGNRSFVLSVIAVGAANLVVLAFVGTAAANGDIGLGELIIFALAVPGAGAILARGNHDFVLANGTDALPAVLELERDAAAAESSAASGVASPAEMPVRELRLEGLSFRYPGAETEVLSELDLSIPAGRSLAIVGANGAGKTTLVQLLAGLYEPTEGRITVDGVDLRQIEPHAWQRRVSAIFQDFTRYDLSARDNVTFGAIERANDDNALVDAARQAGALAVVEDLPHGWDTRLSRQYRDGSEISDGEWQQLALARALFAASAGAGILVLDEPTGHLDVRAEAELYDQFLEITRGLTTIIISHRFSTVRRADRIVVLEAGHVIEDGTHAALLAANGRYAEMFDAQASRFVQEPIHV